MTASTKRRALPSPADRLAIGPLSVSPICLGIVSSPDTLEAAFAEGINFFFVSVDMHWPCYEATRRGLARLIELGHRDDVVVSAVAYVTQPSFCIDPFLELVEAVPGLGRIDLTIAGAIGGESLDARLAPYRVHREGAVPGVRATGATFHDRRAAASALVRPSVDVAFARYGAARWGAERDLFPHASSRRAPLFVFKSQSGWVPESRGRELGLSRDAWFPSPTDHYRFALGPDAVDGLLAAPDTPAQLHAMIRGLKEGALTEEERQYLKDLAELDRGDAVLVA